MISFLYISASFSARFYVLHFHSVIIDQLYLRLYGYFNVIAAFCHVHMYWLVVIGEEKEAQPENFEYRRHINSVAIASQR